MSAAEQAAAKPAWRGLLSEDAFRRLVRMTALAEAQRVLWLGKSDKSAATLEKVVNRPVETLETKDAFQGIAERSIGLMVAPELGQEKGLTAAFTAARAVLETDGVFATVVRIFVGAEVPAPLQTFWTKKQPEGVPSVKGALGKVAAAGYEPLTCELLGEPELSEHDKELLSEARRGVKGEATAEAQSGVHHGVSLGLVVGRRIEPGSPPRWPRRGGGE